MPSVDELLAMIEPSPYFVHGLFQLDDGTWQANLRTKTTDPQVIFFDWGRGPTAAVALWEAMEKIAAKPLPEAPNVL